MTATTAEERAELARLAEDAVVEEWMRRWWADSFAAWVRHSTGVAEVGDFLAAANPAVIRRLLADLDAAENIARLAEESEAGWRREADELAERVAAVSALADEIERRSRICNIENTAAVAEALRAALTTTPTPAAEVGRREESGQ